MGEQVTRGCRRRPSTACWPWEQHCCNHCMAAALSSATDDDHECRVASPLGMNHTTRCARIWSARHGRTARHDAPAAIGVGVCCWYSSAPQHVLVSKPCRVHRTIFWLTLLLRVSRCLCFVSATRTGAPFAFHVSSRSNPVRATSVWMLLSASLRRSGHCWHRRDAGGGSAVPAWT